MTSGVGLVFPGQGSQTVGMGRALYEADRLVKEVYDEASAVLGYDVAALCFDGPAEQLNLTEYTQPALLTASVAAFRAFQSSGVRVLAVAGHSLGEYTAVVAGGGLSFSTALSLVQKRGRYMAEAVTPGSGLVAAVLGLPGEAVRAACEEASEAGVVSAANFNCPGQVVIAGEKAAVERAIEVLKSKGARKVVPLPVSVPVHTPLMRSAAERLSLDFDVVSWSDLAVPLVNNVEAKALRAGAEVKASLVRQLPSPVLWEDSVKTMAALGVSTFVEVGPGTVLSGLIKRIVPAAKTLNVADPASLDVTLKTLAA